MPIYEFKCNKCDNCFEQIVFPSDDGLKCPSCEGKDISRLVSSFSCGSTNTRDSIGNGMPVSGCAHSSGGFS